MVIVVRVIDGVLRPGMKIRLMAEGQDYESLQVGIFTPKAIPTEELSVGEVGFLAHAPCRDAQSNGERRQALLCPVVKVVF